MKYLGIIAVIGLISLTGLGMMLYTASPGMIDARKVEVINVGQQSSGPISPGRPPPLELSRLGLVSLEEVQKRMAEQRSNFTLRLPVLPPGYRVIGASLSELGLIYTDPISKSSFRPQSAEIWIWNANPTKGTTNRDVLDKGGLVIRITYAPGHNSTDQYSNYNNPGYFWGHPGWITYGDPIKVGSPEGTTSIGVYHSGRQVLYHMISSLPAETLLKMMESIVRDT